MTIHAAPALGDPHAEQAPAPAGQLGVLAAEAVSTLATRMSFVVVAWLLLAAEAELRTVGLVAAAQLLAYLLGGPLGVALVDRMPALRLAVTADLLSAPALAAIAYFALPGSALAASPGLLGTAGLVGLAAVAALLRAVSDRAKNAVRRDGDADEAPRAPRSAAVRVLQLLTVLLGGAAAGVLAVRFGPAGVLWLDAVLCAVAAGMLVQAVAVRPRPAGPAPAAEVLSGEVLPADSGGGATTSPPAGASDSGAPAPAGAANASGDDTSRGDAAGGGAAGGSAGSMAAAAGTGVGDGRVHATSAGSVAAGTGDDRVHATVAGAPAASVNGSRPVEETAAPGGRHAARSGDEAPVNGSHPAGYAEAAGRTRPGAALPIARTRARDLRRGALAELRADGLIRRLAVVLFLANLLVQAGAVLLVAAWVEHVLGDPELLGLIGGAFTLGAVIGAVVLSGLSGEPSRYVLAGLAFLVGGGTAAVIGGLPPVLLLIAVVAFVCGATMSSVTPALGMLLSQRVPAPVRSRVGGFASGVAYLGIPLGTVGAAWALPRLELRWALAAAAGLYLVALLVPVFAYRSWRQLGAGAPAVLTGAARLPARLSVTLAYANGQWLVEVRKGRSLLGSRHLVKTSEALSMLSLLDVPGVRRSVEEALTVDQTEATRQAERMRSELAELEAKLAGLSEMAELSEVRLPAQPTAQTREKAADHG